MATPGPPVDPLGSATAPPGQRTTGPHTTGEHTTGEHTTGEHTGPRTIEALAAGERSDQPEPGGELIALPATPPPPADPRLGDVDEWGRSQHLRDLARLAYEPVYSRWHRVEWEGLHKVPLDGGALLVANHAGAIPSDAPVIMHGIESELGRPVYGLADDLFRSLPVVGTLWSRLGGVLAHPDNAYRLLRRQGQLVLAFPEGTKGTSKHYAERYRLRRFGRGGFVEIAMRAGVPVVPLAVVGTEEAMPILWKSDTLAKLLRLPYLPLTANHLLMGPILGTVAPLPAKIRIKVLDPVTFDAPPDRDRYPRNQVMDESERIRSSIQSALYDLLRARRSTWFG